jgi:hypothetical protein
MTTELKRFTNAYATMTVATYEPVILHWISLIGIRFISNAVAYRLPKASAVKFDGKTPAALALSQTLRKPIPPEIDFNFDGQTMRVPIDIHGRAISPDAVKKVEVPNYPNAVAIGKDIYLNGFSETDPAQLAENQIAYLSEKDTPIARAVAQFASRANSFTQGLKAIPVAVSRRLGVQQPDFDFLGTRDGIQQNLIKAAQQWAKKPDTEDLLKLMQVNTNFNGTPLPHMWPSAISIHEALSPIGIAHYYRQLYFNKEEGVGPIEEAFTIAPLETFEVIYQTVRKQIHEEVLEQGLEIVSESAVEEKNLDEVSDKVSSMVQQDVSASMSASASGGIGVWQVGASATANFAVSSQRSRDFSTRRLKEVTKRASERITKSFTIKTRDTTEVTQTTTTRRVIRNDSDKPVSYGLRRVLRRVNVKVQDLGPRLVWQLYLRNPGEGLSRSRFVHFRESGPITVPDVPPGVPPRPSGGVESDSVSTSLQWDSTRRMYYVTIVVKPGNDRDVSGVRIDNITDLEGGSKDDLAPAPHNEFDLGSTWDPATRTYTAKVGVLPGDGLSVQVTYSYTWKPSDSVLAVWQAQRDAAASSINEEKLTKQFEKNKALITEKSKIKSRPANNLRREERYEVMNRMVSHLFGRGDDPSDPTPLEIEYFHRYFDIDAIFTYTHPSWWKPRFASKTVGLEREAYEITADSEPAVLGSSLGWLIQLDGDARRNEFLNSPWARVCVPMRSGREREAIQWLAKHMEGEVGFNINAGPLSSLLNDIENYRDRENKLGLSGADYVTVDSTPGAPADPAKPEGVYPIVEEFDVTMPTDGFVYDELIVTIP